LLQRKVREASSVATAPHTTSTRRGIPVSRPWMKASRSPSPSAPEGRRAATWERPDGYLRGRDDDTAETQQRDPDQVGQREDALGAQGASKEQGERDEGPGAAQGQERGCE